MKKYKIVGRTNHYIANRDVHFNGKTEIVEEKSLTIKEVRLWFLDKYNELFCNERPYAYNVGLAVAYSRRHLDGLFRHVDGFYYLCWDSRSWVMEEDLSIYES